MILLNSFVSPFAARVRLGVYAHDLPVEIAPSGQWLPNYEKSPKYLALNPIGRVPTLVLDDGSALPESTVIVEYLADAFPGCGLRPLAATAVARVRLIAHLAEIYLQAPAGPLFGQLFASDRDQSTIERCVMAMDQGLSHLDHFMEEDGAAASGAITIADCALVPYLFFFADRMTEALGISSIIERHAKVSAYWNRIQNAPVVVKVLDEMRTAIAGSRLSMLVPSRN
ncbi:MAG: glutathione S-transferase family protein [Sphingomonas sp.]|uniref:glutathione S-transferase family protein n=1 Tax=Sphingomonas sp. TaxID=28214 RepID=UPI0017AA8239|nr:glutathione S-transferase family protein [Sphingomonas sp.]MBA3666642.1 glutathione S-transferase family protein [Sphingomonas sp.]